MSSPAAAPQHHHAVVSSDDNKMLSCVINIKHNSKNLAHSFKLRLTEDISQSVSEGISQLLKE